MSTQKDNEAKQLISALENENRRLQKQAAKYQAKCISLQNRVDALEAELKKRPNLAELLSSIELKAKPT